MSVYIVKVTEKLAEGERTVLRDVLGPPEERAVVFVDMHRSENKAEGEEAMYALEISEHQARAIVAAEPENLDFIEEAPEVYPVEDALQMDVDPASAPSRGVSDDALAFHGFDADPENTGEGVAVCVVDSGLHAGYAWTDARLVERWNMTDATGPDGFHGTWCCGAAVPEGAVLVDAQVFAPFRGASMATILAVWHRFADWCEARDLRGVLSNSLGSGRACGSRATTDAARYAMRRGVAVTAASGNDGYRDAVSGPAACEDVYAVGALDRHNDPADQAGFSNSDALEPRVYAAGVREAGQGGTMSGTSMATPLVARALARALSVPGNGPWAARRAVSRSADGRGGFGGVGGVLDVRGALEAARR